MAILFNTILQSEGISVGDVRLLWHQDNRAERGCTPYRLWYDNLSDFELYQSHQSNDRSKFNSPYWASFVGTPDNKTLFVGLYGARYNRRLEKDMPMPNGGIDKAGECDVYDLTLEKELSALIGKLFINWGDGYRAWVQRADRQNKEVTELREKFQEPVFPGFLNFVKPLSEIDNLPNGWITVLKNSGGVYLLTCPKTKEQYVGAAYGADGFWHRWQCYSQTGHGGNVALKSREPSDYQVSILEVAGTASTMEEIIAMEALWKSKLQSKEMGLNRN